MALSIAPSNTLVAASGTTTDYKFSVDRRDDGVCTISLMQKDSVGNWKVATDTDGKAISQSNAGWDDAIPWEAGTYRMNYSGAYAGAADSWTFLDNPADRFGIMLHQGTQQLPTSRLEGCIGATAAFLHNATVALNTAGILDDAIPIEVRGDYSYKFNIQAASSSVREGDDTTFTISLFGPGSANGVTKDVYVRLDVLKAGAGLATYGTDYTISPTTKDGDIKPNMPAASPPDGKARYDAGLYVKIPQGATSVTYKLHANTDVVTTPAEGNEKINLTINDYFVVQSNSSRTYNYSDTINQPGVLMRGTPPTTAITIIDAGKLLSEHLSGGIEGLERVFQVNKGDTITYSFEAYQVPDRLSISDGTNQVGTGGFVSGLHTGQIVASSNEIKVIVVGSNAGTAWDLDLVDQGGGVAAFTYDGVAYGALSATSASASSGAGAVAIPPPSMTKVFTQAVTVPGSGEVSTTFNAVAGKDYFVRLSGLEATGKSGDLADGYLKIFDPSSGSPIVESHFSNLNGAAAAFFHVNSNVTATIKAGSDQIGNGGAGSIEIYDASSLTSPIVFIGKSQKLSTVEGDTNDILIPIYRIGDTSQSATYRVVVDGTGLQPLSSNDLVGGLGPRDITFAAKQTTAYLTIKAVDDNLSEGTEFGTVYIDPTSLPTVSIANATLLGLDVSGTISVSDSGDFGSLIFPTATVRNADGYEQQGHITFDIELSQPTSQQVSISYTTVDGSAIAGQDYTASSGSVVFAPGETRKHVEIAVTNDNLAEGNETFQFKILNATGANLAGSASVTTVNATIHDGAPVARDLGSHGAAWPVSGVGDFNADGTGDILWRNPATGQVDQWQMLNGSWSKSIDLGATKGAQWLLSGIGDFNADGTSDVLWRDVNNSQVDQWQMKNGNWSKSIDLGTTKGAQWTLAGVGDFNADGTSDVLWRNTSTSQVDQWQMKNGNWSKSIDLGATKGADWQLAGVGDFNGDGTADVLWRNIATSQVDQWQMKNGNWSKSIDLGATKGSEWQIAGIGDVNGDKTSDIVWYNKSTGQSEHWVMHEGNWAASVNDGVQGTKFAPAGVGDFDNNGRSELVLLNTATSNLFDLTL